MPADLDNPQSGVDLAQVLDEHLKDEFDLNDVDATMKTMVPELMWNVCRISAKSSSASSGVRYSLLIDAPRASSRALGQKAIEVRLRCARDSNLSSTTWSKISAAAGA